MADSKLFNRLKRMFSSNFVVRITDDNQIKVSDLSKIQAHADLNTNFMDGRRVSGGFRSSFNSTGYGFNETNNITIQRMSLFRDYELMDNDPILSSALDIYADESCVRNEFGDILTIESDDDHIKQLLYHLFYDVLNIEYNLWSWVRNLVKYGDHFLHLHIAENYGVINVIPISPYEMLREEGTDKDNPYQVRFIFNPYGMKAAWQPKNGILENYEVAHFRLLGDSNFIPYGKSQIENARRSWKQLTLLEDAMLIQRILRAPDKRIFKIDVGDIPHGDVEQFMQMIANKMKKTPFVDPATGEYNLKYNIMNMTEDFFIPVRGGDSGTQIDTLPGLTYNAIEDIEYIKNKMLAALKIPKAYLGYEESLAGKTSLVAEDLRFAKTIERIQKVVVSELAKIAIIHLEALGKKGDEILNFDLQLSNSSIIADQEKINFWKDKVQLARDMKESKMFSNPWIYKNIFKFSDSEIDEISKEVIDDAKLAFRFSQIESEGNDPFISGQTFGTPYDIAMMKKNLKGDSSEKSNELDTGETNLKFGLNADLQPDKKKEENITDDPNYDAKYNRTKRKPTPTQYKTDSHPLGRDPIGDKGYKLTGVRDSYYPKKKMIHELYHPNKKKDGDIDEDIKGTFMDEDSIITVE